MIALRFEPASIEIERNADHWLLEKIEFYKSYMIMTQNQVLK